MSISIGSAEQLTKLFTQRLSCHIYQETTWKDFFLKILLCECDLPGFGWIKFLGAWDCWQCKLYYMCRDYNESFYHYDLPGGRKY